MSKKDNFFIRYYSPLIKIREELGIKIQTIADEAEISENTIYRMERGDNITLENYDRICKAYAICTVDILGKEKVIEKYGNILYLYIN